MPDNIPSEGATEGQVLRVGDQTFDLRFDFFLCSKHGMLVPARFDGDWTTDEGCPVLNSHEETCGEKLTPVYLDHLLRGGRLAGFNIGELNGLVPVLHQSNPGSIARSLYEEFEAERTRRYEEPGPTR